MTTAARPSVTAPLLLVVAAAAAVGLCEGVVDLDATGSDAERRRAASLLAYAVATWTLPAAVCVGLGGLAARLAGARLGAVGVGVGLWVAAGSWVAGLAAPLAVLVGVVGGVVAARVARIPSATTTRRLASVAWLAVAVAFPLAAWRLSAPARVARLGPPGTSRPPIVVVNVDTLRWDALSAYRPGLAAPTPHLDAFGADGWTIDDAISPSAWTLPSVTSLWTSRAPREHGVDGLDATLPDDVPLLADHLADHGYATVAVVANPILASDRGFTRGFTWVDDHTHQVEKNLFWVVRAIRRLDDLGLRPIDGGPSTRKLPLPTWSPRVGPTVRHTGYLAADEVTDAAIEWLDRADDADLFLYLHYYDPHDPYLPHPGELLHSDPAFDAAHVDEHVELYRGEVAFLDAQLGRLRDALVARGLLDRALVVITSDHGEEFLDHGGWFHGHTLYDELVRVPLLFRFPADVEPGPAPRTASLLDVTPTILDVAGVAPLPGATGRSLLAVDAPVPRFAERTDEEVWNLAVRVDGLHWTARLPAELGVTPDDLTDYAARVEARPTPLRRWTFDVSAEPFTARLPDGARWDDGALSVDARLDAPLATRGFTADADGLLGVAFDATSPTDGGGPLALRLDRRGDDGTWQVVASTSLRPGKRPAPLVARTADGDTWRLVVTTPDEPSADAPRWRLDDVVAAVDDPRVVFDIEAYDVAADPHQRRDVSKLREHRGARRRALSLLAERAAAPARDSSRPLDDAELQRLRELGYVK